MPSARRIRVLIVDDSVVMRSLLRTVVCLDANLEVAGTAADGVLALNSLALSHPDVILLDVEMPVMDGLTTLRELRRRGNRMPVIMCSSLTQRGAKVTIEALAGGASDYVTKPSGQSGRDTSKQSWHGNIGYRISDEAGANQVLNASVAAGETKTLALHPATIHQPRLWHFDRPNLYQLTAELDNGHSLATTFGIRKIEIRDSAFYLNGEKVRLMGVERMAGSNPEYGMAEPLDWIEHDHADMKEIGRAHV